ncbi:MAG: hypothetical protein O3A25_02560 [Acidobacteria bacterium]|nr:hypothetical protein [Acidobacteriota bacterium]
MIKKFVPVVVLLAAMATLAPVSADAQSEAPMRRPDGQPDISGTFTFRTLTPFQRPEQFATQETLTEEAAAAFEASERTRQNRDLFDPETGARNAGYQPRAEGGVLSYNEFWYERGVDLTDEKRTSLIVDPPTGRLPPRVAGAAAAVEASEESEDERNAARYDSYTSRSTMDRCIMGFNAGPPMTSGAYNNNVMIFQTADSVVILNEMVHNARVIPIHDVDKPPFKQFSGVSRGHWEGDTMVIETDQFRGGESGGTSPNKHLVERITRVNADRVVYEYTVTDPTVYTAPYTVMMPFRRTDDLLFEYACHEGNIGMHGILAGARELERQGRKLRP